jgi:SNF2 family DNA or RNA helicase
MTAVGMLRLLCSSPRLVAESTSDAAQALRDGGLVPDIDGPKIDELRSMAIESQAAGERLVVFSFSRKMIDLVAARFTEDGTRYVTFTGGTSADDRDAAVTAFTTPGTDEDPGPTVFLATDAGAEGLNLGRCCSTVVNLDIPWSASRLEQRANRVHRIDTAVEACLVVNMTLRGTLEEGLLRMVEYKADLADAIFGEHGGRRKTTGRAGRSIFEDALTSWAEEGA